MSVQRWYKLGCHRGCAVESSLIVCGPLASSAPSHVSLIAAQSRKGESIAAEESLKQEDIRAGAPNSMQRIRVRAA